VKTSITAMTTGASFALATLLAIGAPSMSAAATFVYVSDAEDATIDDLGSAAFMVDLASMSHETQYTRLFRS